MKIFIAVAFIVLFSGCASKTHFFQHSKPTKVGMVSGRIDSVYTTVWKQKNLNKTLNLHWVKINDKHILFYRWYHDYKQGDTVQPNSLYVKTFLNKNSGRY